MIFCSECGKDIGSDKFCSYCGTSNKNSKNDSYSSESGFLDEIILKGEANMVIGLLTVGGELFLSNKGLLFKSDSLNGKRNSNKEYYIYKDAIKYVFADGFLNKIVVEGNAENFTFRVSKRDIWVRNISSLINEKQENKTPKAEIISEAKKTKKLSANRSSKIAFSNSDSLKTLTIGIILSAFFIFGYLLFVYSFTPGNFIANKDVLQKNIDDLDFGDFEDFEYDDILKDKIIKGGGYERDGNEEVAAVFGPNIKISAKTYNSFNLGDFKIKWGGFSGKMGNVDQSVFWVYYNDISKPVGEIIVQGPANSIDYYKEGLSIPNETRRTFLKKYGGFNDSKQNVSTKTFTDGELIHYQKKIKDGLKKYFGAYENIERVDIKPSEGEKYIVTIYMNLTVFAPTPDDIVTININDVSDLSFKVVIDSLVKIDKKKYDISYRQRVTKSKKQSGSKNQISFSQAKQFMKDRLRNLNQTMFDSPFFSDAYGARVYVFLSKNPRGYLCISTVSSQRLELINASCGGPEKLREWYDMQMLK